MNCVQRISSTFFQLVVGPNNSIFQSIIVLSIFVFPLDILKDLQKIQSTNQIRDTSLSGLYSVFMIKLPIYVRIKDYLALEISNLKTGASFYNNDQIISII